MEAYAHGLYEGCIAGCDALRWDDFLPGEGDILTHSSVSLDAQRLVVLACIVAPVAAGGAVPAVRVGIDGDNHPRL